MAKTDTTSTAGTWRSRYGIAVKNQEAMYTKFAAWYDLMYAHMNSSKYALWRSKVFLPIIPSKAWAMVAKMTSFKPGWEIGLYGEALNDPKAQDKADKAQWKLEHDWDNPYFDESMPEKLFAPLVDATVTGTGIAKIPWCFEDKTRFEKYINESTGELDPTKDVKIQSGNGYNELIPHDILATFIAPGAKNLYSAAWVILEDWITYDQLNDENEAAGGKFYHNLPKVKDLKAENDQFAQQKRSRRQLVSTDDPITSDTTIKQFKRLECYEKSSGKVLVFAVGEGSDEENFIEIRNEKLPYWHGKYPLVVFYTKQRPHNFWGQGIFEDTERMQSAFNDIFNHTMDNLNLSLDGMIMKQESEEYTYIVQPGGEFLYKNKEPQQFKFPEPNMNTVNAAMTIIERQVEEATISPYATGTPNATTDSTKGTATGIMKLTEMAGDKIGFMKSSFANSLREIGRQWMSNNAQFMDAPFTLMGEVDNQRKPVTIDPKDLQGQMVLRVNDASMEPMSKDQALTQFNAYLVQALTLQKASIEQAMLTKWAEPPLFLNFTSLFQDLSFKMGQSNFDKVVIAMAEVEKKMGKNPANAFLTPKQDIKYTLDNLYGSEAMQLLARDGLQPDPRRQNQVPTPTAPGGATGNQDPGETQANEQAAAQTLTPDHILKAQSQVHQQAIEANQQKLDAAKLAIEAHKSALAEDAQGFDQQHKAVTLAHTIQQAQVQNKQAEKATVAAKK